MSPYLEHFSDDQAKELRREIRAIVHEEVRDELRPTRFRFWAILAGFLITAVLGLAAYQHQGDQQRADVCRTAGQNRTVLRQIVALASTPAPDATQLQKNRTAQFVAEASKILDQPVC